jgi:hypothetical protein
MSEPRKLVTLGMFIIDEFSFLDAAGEPTGRTLSPQEGSTPRFALACTRPLTSFLFSTSDWRRYLYQHRRPHLVRFCFHPSKRDVSPVGWTARGTTIVHERRCCVCFSHLILIGIVSSRLPAGELGMIVDKGRDFLQEIDANLRKYGENMWFFREQPSHSTTTRALTSYMGNHRK